MIRFKMIHPHATEDHLGFIPEFFSESDPRPAKEQINENYSHGGGWRNFSKNWSMLPNGNMQYGDPRDEDADPPHQLIAEATLHGTEKIRFYDGAWVAIVQPDNSFEISRID